MSISGCGVFTHRQETYYVREIEPQQQFKPALKIQIVPTEKNFHILFLIYSRKLIPPYSIRFSSYAKQKPVSHFLLHSFRLTSGEDLIAEEQFSPPLILDLSEKKSGEHVFYELNYLYELGNSLQFEKGKMIELEVSCEQPGVSEKKTIRLKGMGEEKHNTSSLWDAYMSV